jgi:hypothetical protein
MEGYLLLGTLHQICFLNHPVLGYEDGLDEAVGKTKKHFELPEDYRAERNSEK